MTTQKQSVSKDQVQFDNTSYIDPNGQVFKYDNRIFRGINNSKKNFFLNLLKEPVFLELCKNNKIVNTTVSDLTLDEYELVLEHEKVSTLSYCIEWSPQMLKDAALLTLEITIELSKHALTLQDAYPWNIHFKGSSPIFIDVGSIVPIEPGFLWKPYDQFCRFFLFPLFLHAKGKSKITNFLLTDYFEGVSTQTLNTLLGFKDKFLSPSILAKATIPFFLDKLLSNKFKDMGNKYGSTGSALITPKMRTSFLEMLKKDVQKINVTPKKAHWFNYYNTKFNPTDNKDQDLQNKTKVIEGILDKYKPATVLDQGANTGHFSVLAANKGIKVIACEQDISCVNLIYNTAKASNLDIVPLVSNFINPAPSFGWCSKQFPSFLQRTRSEMVFALALIHHLIFKQWQSFERIAETLDMMSSKWAIVEFIPIDDEFIAPCWEDRFSFYTIENLQKAMSTYFTHVETVDSYPDGRKILVFAK